jgi:hypothetical protein
MSWSKTQLEKVSRRWWVRDLRGRDSKIFKLNDACVSPVDRLSNHGPGFFCLGSYSNPFANAPLVASLSGLASGLR